MNLKSVFNTIDDMKKCAITIILLLLIFTGYAQPAVYTTANAHSHNDYEQKEPFSLAYNEQFGSIEADIFLKDGELLVSHDVKGLELHRTFEEYYLQPLVTYIEKNNGYAYSDTSRILQLLIDLKTPGAPTLNKLVELIEKYPLAKSRSIRWVISGNKPTSFNAYPSFILFDGDVFQAYSKEQLQRISLISGNFKKISNWNGKSAMRKKDFEAIKNLVQKVHAMNKPIRFWGAPDGEKAWKKFMKLKVDYINTDHISDLARFIKKQNE